jgi:hypothetical protein
MIHEMSELETFVQYTKIGIAVCLGVVFFTFAAVILNEVRTIREFLLSTDNYCQQAGKNI